jgi:predicted DNA-binding transcriptional regulator AlpA
MLYKLNAAGRMPTPVRLGSLMRWRRKEIMEWIDAGCPTGGQKETRK